MEDAGANQNFVQPNEFLGQNNQTGINYGDKKEFQNDRPSYSGTGTDQDMLMRSASDNIQGSNQFQ